MLIIDTPDREYYNEETNQFITIPGRRLHFENTLKVLAEWESLYRKPFLTREEKTTAELFDYFILMCQDEITYDDLTSEVVTELGMYLNDVPTATTITKRGDRDGNTSSAGMIQTSEVIYACMANARVPFECENWNLHRLLTMLAVISELNNPDKKKMSKAETLRTYEDLNAKRLAQIKQMKKEKLNASKGNLR